MKKFLPTYAPAAVSALLLFFCFPAMHWYFLAWAALVPLFYTAAKSAPLRAGLQFFLAGWLFHSLLLQWLIGNIHWAGGWAVLGYQGLCLFLALFWFFPGLLWGWARRRENPFTGALLLAGLWIAMEWAMANLFSGFGWSALGYSQGPDQPFVQLAAAGSVYLLSFLVVLVNALIALLLAESRARPARITAIALIPLLAHGAGYLMIGEPDYDTEPFRAGIVQTNFAQLMKWDRDFTEDMIHLTAEYSKQLAAVNDLHLLVWPEAVVMRHFEDEKMFAPLAALAKEIDTPLFTGAVRAEGNKEYNSSVLVDTEGNAAGHYDKIHLAPFGEYLPFEDRLPFLSGIVPGGVDPGSDIKVFDVPGADRRIGPLICFEVLFGPMAEALRREKADLLVVITNLGWFGASNATAQELEQARLRAIETRLPLVHAANTGISGVFDPWGRFRTVNATLINGRFGRWEEPIAPASALMQRRMGAFPVAAPATRPAPWGPALFPWAVLAFAAIWILLAAVAPAARETESVEEETDTPLEEAAAGDADAQ
jgi:apolipoprotein N-acyltransferase